MEIEKSFTYVFEEPKWLQKLAIGAVVSIIPIVNFAWVGYMIEVMRNIFKSDPLPLPEWGDFGDKFMKGLFISLAMIIYSLPALILFCLPVGFLIPTMLQENQDIGNALAGMLTGTWILVLCCFFVYMIVLSFFYPAMIIHYARQGTFSSCFQVREFLQLATSNMGDYLIAWLISILASLAVGAVVSVLSAILSPIICIGWIIALALSAISIVYPSLVYVHLFGQVGIKQSAIQQG